MEFEFDHTIRTITPPEAITVQVTAVVEREDGPCEVGYTVPVGVSGEAVARLALEHYEIIAHAWEIWRERLAEIAEARPGIAGDREAG